MLLYSVPMFSYRISYLLFAAYLFRFCLSFFFYGEGEISVHNIFLFLGEEVPVVQSSSANRDLDFQSGRIDSYVDTVDGALQDIAIKCGTKVWCLGFSESCYLFFALYFLEDLTP